MSAPPVFCAALCAFLESSISVSVSVSSQSLDWHFRRFVHATRLDRTRHRQQHLSLCPSFASQTVSHVESLSRPGFRSVLHDGTMCLSRADEAFGVLLRRLRQDRHRPTSANSVRRRRHRKHRVRGSSLLSQAQIPRSARRCCHAAYSSTVFPSPGKPFAAGPRKAGPRLRHQAEGQSKAQICIQVQSAWIRRVGIKLSLNVEGIFAELRTTKRKSNETAES